MPARTLRKRAARTLDAAPSKRAKAEKGSPQKRKELLSAETPQNLHQEGRTPDAKVPELPNSLFPVPQEASNRIKIEEISTKLEPKNTEIAPRRVLRPRRTASKPSYVESEDEYSLANGLSKTKTDLIKDEKSQKDTEMLMDTKPAKRGKKTKDNPYGLTPGITPFPHWTAPSVNACEDVYNRLSKLHGHAKPPEKIPAPSLDVSGCGEVPSVLDALIRTRLSANTSSKNSSAAFRSLVKQFGLVQNGIGKGSVDWNNVRLAPITDIVGAIKCGGLAQTKGRDIKAILGMVHEENAKRRSAFLGEKTTGKDAEVVGISEKTQGQKDLEILKSEHNILSLDHIHGMHPNEAMQALVKYPGIGVKTASCVILFCLQQPSFAVDTHVHRITGWLGWVPPKANRDETFSHLEHGRTCIRCRANTSEGSEEWAKASCPIDGLVKRVGKRKSTSKPVKSNNEDSDASGR